MATYNLRRFSDPDALKKVSPERLLELLRPHAGFFTKRGVTLPADADAEALDYEGLVSVFMSPDTDTPKGLGDALYFINEMATPETAEELLEELQSRGVSFDGQPDPTPTDVALRAWLFNRDLLERKHAEQFLTNPRTFEHFQTDEKRKVPAFKDPTRAQLTALEQDLDDWFESKKRGRGTRVFFFKKADGVWFMVRHGELFKREGAINAGKSESVFYRPEKHDVLRYDAANGEISIHAGTARQVELYRTMFGQHLFGDKEFFPGTSKYTLEPLKKDGAASLVCSDVQGMEWVRLKEIRYNWGGPHSEMETRTADDLFAAWAERNKAIHPKARIVRASFLVKFADSKTPRTVTIRPSNIAKYTRDDDAAVVEDFLRKRGFMIARDSETEEREEEAIADLAGV